MTVVFCPPGANPCNAEDHGHRCGLRPEHEQTFHVCPCYWRWPAPRTPRALRATLVVLAVVLVAVLIWAGIMLGGAR